MEPQIKGSECLALKVELYSVNSAEPGTVGQGTKEQHDLGAVFRTTKSRLVAGREKTQTKQPEVVIVILPSGRKARGTFGMLSECFYST